MIPDFSKSELWVIRTTLKERYGKVMDLQEIESEIRLNPHDRDTTVVPGVYWEFDECHFVIVKAGENRYRSQFFYEPWRQYAPTVPEFDDMANCVVSTLQAQSDIDAKRSGNIPEGARRPRSL